MCHVTLLLALGAHLQPRTSPASRLRGGSDTPSSPEEALRFTHGCLVGLESKNNAVSLLLPAFRAVMRYLGTPRAHARRKNAVQRRF